MADFLVRVNGGGKTGFGHVNRMLSLARYLFLQHKVDTFFLIDPYPGLREMFTRHGFRCVENEGLVEEAFLERALTVHSPVVLLIDRLFPYESSFIRSLRERVKVILFQNECPGMFEADWSIFPAAHLDDSLINDPRWEKGTATFLHGPDYVVINEEVRLLPGLAEIAASSGHLAIATGASDPEGVLLRLAQWLDSEGDIPVRALIGFDFCRRDELEALRGRLGPTVQLVPFNVHDLVTAQVAIAAFGVTVYELLYAGVPLLTLGHAERNAKASRTLQDRYRCNVDMGLFADLQREDFLRAVRLMWEDADGRRAMRERQLRLLDGKGLERVAAIVADALRVQQATSLQMPHV